MKTVLVQKDENNILETHIFGDVIVPQSLEDYTFPGSGVYFMTINLEEYNFNGLDEGRLYIFLDLLGYFSEDYGEYALVPMAYYSKEKPLIIFDDFNEDNYSEFSELKDFYLLDDGEGISFEENKIKISDKNIIEFFLHFDDDIKEVYFIFDEMKENKFNEGIFKIVK